ncbi:hypothetical protein FRC06_001490 [Ceratobasidium sp. 370]|nr:hypothetical protein FRC06_001490 [Ceratobasidium sp. 370]
MADHSVWPSTPATPPPQRPDLQLRDSVRKIRKRVVSVIRRGSKTGKSRSASVDRGRSPSEPHDDHPHDDDSDHKHAGDADHKDPHDGDEHVDSGDEHHSQHSARSRTSSTHSIRHSLFGSRSASPQPPAASPQHNGHLTAPSSPSAMTRRLSSTFGFPRTPSRKHKTKGTDDQTPEPSARPRTISTPGPSTSTSASALENLVRLSTAGLGVAGAGAGNTDEHGKLTIPIPKRERALSHPSHPLAASPIQAASPPAEQGMVFSFGSAMQQQLPTKADMAPAQLETTTTLPLAAPALAPAVPATAPAPIPDVIAAPAPDVFTAPTPQTEITTQVVEQRPITPSTGLTREQSNASIASSQTHDTSVGHTRESSGGHAREPSGSQVRESSGGREPNAVLSRTASTIGSELGWSILEPTKEEDEPEDEGTKSQPQVKVEEVPVSLEEPVRVDVPVKAEEVAIKAEETPAEVEEVPSKVEEVPLEVEGVPAPVEAAPAQVEEAPAQVGVTARVEDAVQTDEEELLAQPALPASGERTPLAAEGDEEHMNGAFTLSPEPTEGARTRQPSTDLESSGFFIDTPPRETRPKWISSVPTPPRSTPTPPRSATPPRPRMQMNTPMTPPAQTGAAFVFGSSSTPAEATIQDSPETPSPSRFSGTYTPYTGDQTPPPASTMSDSFFHPSNVERLNPRHFERSMSTMGVFGDGEPDGAGVQERLGVDARLGTDYVSYEYSMRPSIDTMLAPDTSVHEMISPSVRAAANGGTAETDLRSLAGTELRDWYEGEGRTPKTVRMMLPGDEAAGPSAIANGASVSRPRSALSQSHTPPQLAPSIVLTPPSQEVQQPQSERAQVYSSVLSRLMSHMDRRSTLMSRLATRLGNLGGLPVVERHPREWVAQALPSGKVYYAHRLVSEGSPQRQAQTQPAAADESSQVAKVLVIPTPSAPQPVTLGEDAEFDLEMERRYWAYIETHPAHADVNPRAVQEAIELLTWHYTDRLLAEKKRGEKEPINVKPPFTPEESHEVLEFLKSLSQEHSHANAILKTRTVARVHVRTAEWRLAKLQAVHDAVNLEVMSPAERIRRRRAAANPFVGVPLRTLAGLLGLGIPYLFVEQPDEKVEDRQRMMVADASTNLMVCYISMMSVKSRSDVADKSALMLGASVSFLAIPDLEDIARLAGVAAAACSLGSLAAGILRLRLPSRAGPSEETREDESKPSALRTFARSLPLVLSAYAGSALVAGLAAYSWRGQVSPLDDPFTRLYFDDSWRTDQAGGRWLGGLVRRDGGSGHGPSGLGSEPGRPGWAEASSQGIIRLWGTW